VRPLDQTLFRIGELAAKANVSPRTIDFYTTIGLIRPAKRTAGNYRLYGLETIERLKRIEELKKEKYTLEEIKEMLDGWRRVSSEEQISRKLTDLQLSLSRLQRDVKELEPVLSRLKPHQVRSVYKRLMPQTAACVEALLLLIDKASIL
jgi:Predicted transcriptional regulators